MIRALSEHCPRKQAVANAESRETPVLKTGCAESQDNPGNCFVSSGFGGSSLYASWQCHSSGTSAPELLIFLLRQGIQAVYHIGRENVASQSGLSASEKDEMPRPVILLLQFGKNRDLLNHRCNQRANGLA